MITNGTSTTIIIDLRGTGCNYMADLMSEKVRLDELKHDLISFKRTFGHHLRGGLIPYKGYSPPSDLPEPKILREKSPLDLRKIIQKITTPRPTRRLLMAFL